MIHACSPYTGRWQHVFWGESEATSGYIASTRPARATQKDLVLSEQSRSSLGNPRAGMVSLSVTQAGRLCVCAIRMLGVSFVNEEADRYLMMHSMDGVIGFTVAKMEALHSGDPQSVKEAVTTQRNHTR